MTISEMVAAAHAMAREKGWHDEERNCGEMLALVHSEVSEALEEYRNGRGFNETWFDLGKPSGFPGELADILIRVADMAGLYGIDLEEAVRVKMAYNATRPHRHGSKRA